MTRRQEVQARALVDCVRNWAKVYRNEDVFDALYHIANGFGGVVNPVEQEVLMQAEDILIDETYYDVATGRRLMY